MTRRLTSMLVLGIAGGFSIAMGGCARSGPPALSNDPAEATVCLVAPGGAVVTEGQDEIHHRTDTPVTLVSVSLVNAHGLALTGPVILPVEAGLALIGGPFPPTRPGNDPVKWGDRIPVGGVVGSGVEDANLVFGVSLTPGSSSGQAAGTRLEFRQSGELRSLTTTIAVKVLSKPEC